MIDINLLPADLKKKKKKSLLPSGINIPTEIIVGSVGAVLMLLVFIHVLLFITNFAKFSQHRSLEKALSRINPEKQKIDEIISQIRSLNGKISDVEGLYKGSKLSWAKKLNLLSNDLPRGVWLSKLALMDDTFFIEGSAISNQSNELINVHALTAALKKDTEFSEGLLDLEVGPILTRNIQKVEIADFLITVKTNESK